MGYFEACANPVRTDATGRRVIVPFRWFGPVYLLRDDAEVARIKHGFKWLQIVSIVFIAIAAPRIFLFAVPPVLAVQALWIYILTRGLPDANLKASELPRISRGEAAARTTDAMGKPLAWTIRAVWVPASILFLWGAWVFRGFEAWIVVPMVLLVDAMMVVDIMKERTYRKSLQSPQRV